MAEIKLVIFDCDGVLVDSEYLAARLEQRRYGEHGLELGMEEFCERFSGMTGEAIFETVQEIIGKRLPKTLQNEIEVELDRMLDDELEPIAGVEDALDRIDRQWCICSNSSEQRLERVLTNMGFHHRFAPNIFSARTVSPGRPKPAPDVFAHAIRFFGVDPREAVILEDSVHGVHAGVAAGARVVGFIGGRHSFPSHGEQLSAAGAETVIRRLVDFPELVRAFSEWDGVA